MSRRRHRRHAQKDAPLISTVAKILAKGEPTKFAFEAACRHSLRAAFCLDGKAWTAADARAAAIVAEALRRLGVTRPTWQEANPEDVVAQVEWTRCARCGKTIPPAENLNGYSKKYCSLLCKGAAQKDRERRGGRQFDRAAYLAAMAAKTAKTEEERAKSCERCGQGFVPDGRRDGHKDGEQRYCSRRCAYDARPKQLKAKPCAGCGEVFQPRLAVRKFCCIECSHGFRKAA
jgi:hypothetical protein